MKRVFLILAALAAWTATAATPGRTATEAYVTNKIAAAVAAIPPPDLSGYLPKSGGTMTGSLTIKTSANGLLDLYNDDPNLYGRVTVDWLIQDDGPSTFSLWDRFRNIHYDFPTNGGTIAMMENLTPPDLSPYLRNDKSNNEVQIFGGLLSGFGFHADTGHNDNGWNQYTAHNGTSLSQSLPSYIQSNPWQFMKWGEAIPTTGGVFNAYLHLNQKFSVGTWTSSVKPIDSPGGSGIAFAFGDNVQTRAANTMVLGVGALNTNAWSFIWNGDANRMYIPTVPSMSNPYATRYNGGFHVNPSVRSGMVNPLQNFWIGDTNLNDWISALAPIPTWDTLSGKPTFATVATSGAYSDLSGKPSIPTTAADVGAYSTGDVDLILQDYLPLEYFKDGQTIPMYKGDGTKLCDFGANWLGILVDDIDGKADKATTLSGYGITDALKADFSTLTNNAAFTSAVAAVSPPVDLSGYCTTGEAAGIASNVVSQAYIRQKLGVYLYVGEDGGIYVHTEE